MSTEGTPAPCPEEMQIRVSRYVDGELTPDERGAVDEHVSGCAACRDLLSLFQKNENLTAGALTTDAFGDAVVASVLQSLRKEDPPEARPVEETFGDWLRARPFLPLAAAALLVVGLVVILNASHRGQMGELKDRLSTQEKSVEDAAANLRKAAATALEIEQETARRNAAYEKLIRDIRTDFAIANARHGTVLTSIENEGVLVKATFDPKGYDYYEVWRRGDLSTAYTQLSPELRLDKPEYLDRQAVPGQLYWYKFRAVKRGGVGGWVESASHPYRVPSRLETRLEEAIQIWCQDVSAPRDMAKFLLERTVKGRKISHVFYANLGEPIGDVVDVAGAGRVDFRTGLTVGRIQERQQALAISLSETLLDETGKELIERIENGRIIPASRQHSGALNLKTNDVVEMQPQGAPGQPAVPVWKGSWIVVPAAR